MSRFQPKPLVTSRTREISNLTKKDNQQMPTLTLWSTAKAGLRGKFIALSAYVRKEVKAQVSKLSSHLKNLEEEQHRLRAGERICEDESRNQ